MIGSWRAPETLAAQLFAQVRTSRHVPPLTSCSRYRSKKDLILISFPCVMRPAGRLLSFLTCFSLHYLLHPTVKLPAATKALDWRLTKYYRTYKMLSFSGSVQIRIARMGPTRSQGQKKNKLIVYLLPER